MPTVHYLAGPKQMLKEWGREATEDNPVKLRLVRRRKGWCVLVWYDRGFEETYSALSPCGTEDLKEAKKNLAKLGGQLAATCRYIREVNL